MDLAITSYGATSNKVHDFYEDVEDLNEEFTEPNNRASFLYPDSDPFAEYQAESDHEVENPVVLLDAESGEKSEREEITRNTALLRKKYRSCSLKVGRVVTVITSLAASIISFYYAWQAMQTGHRSLQKYTRLMAVSGSAYAIWRHCLFPFDVRKQLNILTSGYVYEIFFILSTAFRAIDPIKYRGLKDISKGAFVFYGFFLHTRDILSRSSFDLDDYSPCNDSKDLIPTCSPSTRGKIPYKWLTFKLTLALVGTGAFFGLRNSFPNADDLHKAGLYGGITALFTGGSLADVATRAFEIKKEGHEKAHIENIKSSSSLSTRIRPPMNLEIMRIAKAAFITLSPPFTGLFLLGLSPSSGNAIDNPANSVKDFAIMMGVGYLFQTRVLFQNGEYENPLSQRHTIRKNWREGTESEGSRFSFLANYILALGVLGGLILFRVIDHILDPKMSTPEIIGVSIVMIIFSWLSFGGANLLINTYTPVTKRSLEANNPTATFLNTAKRIGTRILNEIDFQITNPDLMGIVFEYLTMRISINSASVRPLSSPLAWTAMGTWAIWAIYLGAFRALYAYGVQRNQTMTAPASIETFKAAIRFITEETPGSAHG